MREDFAYSARSAAPNTPVWITFAVSLLLWQSAHGALLIDEPFNYTLGNLGTQGSWVQSGSQPELIVANGNLSVSGLIASTGNKVTFSGAGRTCYKTFSGPASGTVYFSFILRVNASPSAATLFSSLNAASTSKRLCVHLGTDNRLGLSYNAGTVTYGGSALTVGTDYLIVGSLELVTGSNNDIYRLWVSPSASTFGATEPSPDAQMTSGGDTALSSARFYFQRDAGNSGVDVDELRVGVSWAEVTPSSGSVQTVSATNSTLSVNPTSANVGASVLITVTERDISNQAMTNTGITPVLSASAGKLGTVASLGNGVYTATLTYTNKGSVNISGTFSGTAIGNGASVSAYFGTLVGTNGCFYVGGGFFPGTYNITFQASAGQSYSVLSTTNLALPMAQWSQEIDVATGNTTMFETTYPASPSAYSFTVQPPASGPVFYRVRSP